MRRLILLIATALIVAGARASNNSSSTRADFLSLFEDREWHDERMPGRHTCDIFLRLHTRMLRDPAGYANVCVEEAVDDTGASLVDLKSGLGRGLTENSNVRLLSPLEVASEPDPSIILRFRILPAARNARKIVRVRGHVQVRGGGDSIATVRIPKLRSHLGQNQSQISDPQLARQQLKLELSGDASTDGAGYFRCDFNGNLATLRKVRVVDDDRRQLGEGQRPSGDLFFGGCVIYLELPRPPDDRMSLEIDLAENQSVLTVPFELHDVELP